eukprot:TRINITY_DN3023_c0_g1_i10.p1 TRINITY_DN3023_c0_g1~~TRINITY_DN3023_c0_g1_i10.p1  ORF type:complete len:605 (-),score=107.73 TRINITY_DN3023_c0_g1_i10:1026-2840(-)
MPRREDSESDQDEGEVFRLVGTPLSDATDPNESSSFKRVPVWEQEVKDEKGRRRFHGAFTGGFSAGYFNTVGSKEGWTPSTFQSSRASRAESRASAPEDFMDDEDKELFGGLVAKSSYDTLGTVAENRRKATEAIATLVTGAPQGSVLQDIVGPSSDSIGKKLLRHMGWREGQGVGPKSRTYKKPKGIGSSSMNEDDMVSGLAPKNAEAIILTPKNDTYGIGYNPQMRSEMATKSGLEQANQSKPQVVAMMDALRSKRSTSTKGFGVGTYEDDDEDVYGGEDMSQYDLEIGKSWKKETQKQEKKEISQDRSRKCNDGRYPISGYSLASAPPEQTKWYKPPIVPSSFIPRHIFPEDTNTEQTVPGQGMNILERRNLTYVERGALLGEKAVVIKQEPHASPYPMSTKPEPQSPRPYAANSQQAITEWESEREKSKPMVQATLAFTLSISDRFVSKGAVNPENPEVRSSIKTETPKPDMKMLGRHSRTEVEYRPSKLLCKRFNVPDPHFGKQPVVGVKEREKERAQFTIMALPTIPQSFARTAADLPDATKTSDPVSQHAVVRERTGVDGEKHLHVPERHPTNAASSSRLESAKNQEEQKPQYDRWV